MSMGFTLFNFDRSMEINLVFLGLFGHIILILLVSRAHYLHGVTKIIKDPSHINSSPPDILKPEFAL